MAELLELMKSQAGRHLTVHEICGLLEEKGASVGMTTVYRNLEKLVDQGIIAKYTIDGTTSACLSMCLKKKKNSYLTTASVKNAAGSYISDVTR